MTRKNHELTAEQIDAINALRRDFGKEWKNRLRLAWQTGAYPRTISGAQAVTLQRVRNTLGPRWLHSYTD